MTSPAPYVVAACQTQTQTVFGENGSFLPGAFAANVKHYCDLIAQAATLHGAKLVAFPQFGLTGYAQGLAIKDWLAASVTFPGAEIEPLARQAKSTGTYVAIQVIERHEAFPDRYFLSCAFLTPAGEVGAVYRKHYTFSMRTNPIDVHDDFIRVFGKDAFFPVLETPIGMLGAAIGLEVQFPEVVRSLALRGAEVVINPVAMGESVDYLARPAAESIHALRALENSLYMVRINRPSIPGSVPSHIYDYDGNLIGSAGENESFALATIDIGALREARKRPGLNHLAQFQPAIHEDRRDLDLWPVHAFRQPAQSFGEIQALEAKVWRNLAAAGRVRL